MEEQFLGVPFVIWGALCLALAAVFVFIWPSIQASGQLSTLRYLLLRWGHAAVWGLLGLAAFARGLAGSAGATFGQVAAVGALLVYFAFLAVLLRK